MQKDLTLFSINTFSERSLRHESTQLGFNITGPYQVRPSDFSKELKNIRFKQALVDLFILHWSTEEMVQFMNYKNIVVNFKKCQSFTVTNNTVVSNIDETLTCTDHEEAETKIIHHICNIDVQANFVIRCSDTDIAAIMLGNMRHLKNEDSHVWILIGIGNRMLPDFNYSSILIWFLTSIKSSIERMLEALIPENNGCALEDNPYHFNWFDGDQLLVFVSESLQDESEAETKDADEDNENIQYQHWIDDEISNYNDKNNED
ncbi:uncharacterized protein TNCV_4617051 [Trichonephila clavipes]|nr:uncharacterized protein TNCV_4617051 [Trichonephila clavipes]